MRLKRSGVMLLGVGAVIVTSGARSAGAAAPVDTLTEWTIPFADSSPLWVAVRREDVVFTDFGFVENLGRLDPQSGLVTEWPLPYVATIPGDLKVRSADGAILLTALNEGEIGEFNVETQVLRRWPLPVDSGAGFVAPWGLAIDEDGRVLFSASRLSNDGSVLGRLDTTTGAVDLWTVPASMVIFMGPLAIGPSHTVFFADSGFGPRSVVRLDTTTGGFTAWAMSNQPSYDIVADGAGRVYLQQITGSAWSIARLIPGTGRVTEWQAPGSFNDRMSVLGNRVLFGSVTPTGLAALDSTHPGLESVAPLSPAGQTVTPVSTVITPIDDVLVGQTAQSVVQSRTIRRRSSGAFEGWRIDGQPRDIATSTSPTAAYFSEANQAAIGRISN